MAMVYMGSVTNDKLWGRWGGEVAGVWRYGRSCRILLDTWLTMEVLMGLGGGVTPVLNDSFMHANTLGRASLGVGLLGLVAWENPFKYYVLFTNPRMHSQ